MTGAAFISERGPSCFSLAIAGQAGIFMAGTAIAHQIAGIHVDREPTHCHQSTRMARNNKTSPL